MYRNCRVHGQTEPSELWKNELLQLESNDVPTNVFVDSLRKSPIRIKHNDFKFESLNFIVSGDRASIHCSGKIPKQSPELSDEHYQNQIELKINTLLHGMGYTIDKPVYSWGTKTHIYDESFFLYSGIVENFN